MKFDFSAPDLNATPEEERKAILTGPFGRWKMEQSARYVAPFWWIEPRGSRVLLTPTSMDVRVHNGTAFFVEIEGNLFCVTAAHVYRGYLEAKAHYPGLICRLGEGGSTFSPEHNLCGLGGLQDGVDKLDIATFHITTEALRAINKEPLVVPRGSWPQPHPFSGQQANIVGYPGNMRLWMHARAISFGVYFAGPSVGAATNRQITLPFNRDGWIDIHGHGLPPQGMDIGGMSGGPLLIITEMDHDWFFNIAGVISEMPSSQYYETVIVEPAHFIGSDGSILREQNVPTVHYIPAPTQAAAG